MPDLHAATWTGPETFEVRADARRFETFESHVAGRLGLGVAVRYALGWSLEAIFGRVRHLAERLRAALRATDGVTVYDVGRVQGAIVTFAAAQMEADAIQQRLRAEGINVSVSTPASTRLDAEARALPNLVRASVHYYNTESEIAHAAEVLRRLLQNG
jgi:selenocysteine lyase/cysteine desulfurase